MGPISPGLVPKTSTIVDDGISKKRYLLFMKYKRQKRLRGCRRRVILREDRKFLLHLESNPLTSVDGEWVRKERRCLQDLLFNLLPYLAYRLRSDKNDLLRVILLYDHYLTVLNTLRTLRGKCIFDTNHYIRGITNRLYLVDDEGTVAMLNLLV